MSATIVRIRKEARAIAWPWCAIILAGALPGVVNNSYTRKLDALGFFVGIPVLAALSLGNEFRERTLSLWLTQPFSRRRLWAEKMTVLCAAVLSAGLVSGIGVFSYVWPDLDLTWKLVVIHCVLVATASTPFWTLAARSTMGAIAFITFYLASVFLLGGNLAPGHGQGPPAALSAATITAVSVLSLCYMVLILRLGERRLAQFQVTGGSADDDLLAAGSEVMPGILTRGFRCRPSGAIQNLIRKEVRLLRPLWLFTLLMMFYLAFAVRFGLVPEFPLPLPEDPARMNLNGLVYFAVFMTLGSFFLLAPVFAGVLSLGEEKTLGTHAWQMTLPVSPLRQWLTKLVMAMLAGFAGAVLLPLLVVLGIGSALGSPFMFVGFRGLHDWMILVPFLTFAAFWCSCAAYGTMRASLWIAAATAAIVAAKSLGMGLGETISRAVGTVNDVVVSSLHLSPFALAFITSSFRERVLWLFAPTLLIALFQSYRLFRAPVQESALWTLRCLTPLVALTILWGFSVTAGFAASKWEPFEETRHVLDPLQSNRARLELTGDDLAKSTSLTAPTRRWLSGASIVVVPDPAHSSGYLATIHLASGLECSLTVAHYGGTAASCGSKHP